MIHTFLVLHITEYSCRCGNKWVHSYTTLSGGSGRPTPQESHKLPVNHIIHGHDQRDHCHLCAPLGLGIGWQSLAEKWQPTSPVRSGAPAKKVAAPTNLSSLLED